MSGIAEALRAQAATLLALADSLAITSPVAPQWYTRHHLPQGARSWRAVRMTAHREGIPTSRPGRELLVDAAAWDAWASTKRSTRRAEPPPLTDRDAKALEALGVVMPRARAGTK